MTVVNFCQLRPQKIEPDLNQYSLLTKCLSRCTVKFEAERSCAWFVDDSEVVARRLAQRSSVPSDETRVERRRRKTVAGFLGLAESRNSNIVVAI